MGPAIGNSANTITLTKSATIFSSAQLIQDTSTSRYYGLVSGSTNICTTQTTLSGGLTDFYFEIQNVISDKSAVTLIRNGGNGNYLRKCTSSCTGSNGSKPAVLCDFTKTQALADPNGQWILTST
jgi:hypothetical protein